MFELIAFLALCALAVGAFLLVGFLFKVLFKIALFPLWLALGLIKLAVGLVIGLTAAVLFLVLAPLAIVLLVFVALPLVALIAVFGLGWTLVAA